MGMATILASLNACTWAIVILVSVEAELPKFLEVATWNLIFIWVVFWCAVAQIKTARNINWIVLLMGRIGTWFLLIGLTVEIAVSGYT